MVCALFRCSRLSVLLLCSNKNPVCNVYKPRIQKVRNITGKTPIAKSCFKIQENWLAVDLMIMPCKAFETLIGRVCMPLCANAHPHLTYLLLFSFSLLAVYHKVLMLECLHFSHTTGSLHHDGWMTLQLRRCYSVLLLSGLVVCEHRVCNALWPLAYGVGRSLCHGHPLRP